MDAEGELDHPVRFVAITGYGQETDKEKPKPFGFDAHLVKPVDISELADFSTSRPRRGLTLEPIARPWF